MINKKEKLIKRIKLHTVYAIISIILNILTFLIAFKIYDVIISR